MINEALCFGLPMIISDRVGVGKDLVNQGQNGLVFPIGDIDSLADCPPQFLTKSTEEKIATRTDPKNHPFMDM